VALSVREQLKKLRLCISYVWYERPAYLLQMIIVIYMIITKKFERR